MKYCFTLLVALAFTVGVGCSKDEGGDTPAKTPGKSTTDSLTDKAGDAMKEGGDAMKEGGDAMKDGADALTATNVTYQCKCGVEKTLGGDLPAPS